MAAAIVRQPAYHDGMTEIGVPEDGRVLGLIAVAAPGAGADQCPTL
jgi:hypothetical protein